MGLEIQPYRAGDVEAVRAFNARLKQGGCAFQFPERAESAWLPPAAGEKIYEEYFLARAETGVHGGYILKHQPFRVDDREVSIGSLYLPLSEGVVDKRHNPVGFGLLRDALHRQPLLYSLGMGGFHNPYPRLLKAAGWSLCAVPFFFHVARPNAFFKNIVHLRHSRARRLALDFLAASGLGYAGVKLVNALNDCKGRRPGALTAELVPEFGPWADEVWAAGRERCSLVAVRDAKSLRRLYPADKLKYLKLKVSADGMTSGWAVLLDTPMTNHKQFGAMRVGSVIDCFAASGGETAVATAAKEFLIGRGVDLLVTNQSHRDWRAAFSRAGFLSGPSNFIFAASPPLVEAITPFEQTKELIHFTRGDGEGPSHL
ncbi:MAG: hypothetical protein HZA89_04070 [Verrucomicrobia bacterium]|nr:hypothetical protein [Verrucomicrobiota bacterium]